MKPTTLAHPKIFLLSIFILFSSCAYFSAHGRSYKKAASSFKNKRYSDSVNQCAKSLGINAQFNKSIELMDLVFPKAIDYHHELIEGMKSGGGKNEQHYWEHVLNQLLIVQKLTKVIEDLNHPKTSIWLENANVRNYDPEINQARENAAEGYYQDGINNKNYSEKNEISGEKYRSYQRYAAKMFKRSQSFISNYKDSESLYIEAKEAGMTRIAIMPFIDRTRQYSSYGSIGEEIASTLRSELLNDPSVMEFVKIVDRQQIDRIIAEQKLSQSGLVNTETSSEIGKLYGVHQMISGEVTMRFAEDPSTHSTKTIHEKDVVIERRQVTGEDGKKRTKKIYGTVKASLVTHKTTSKSKVKASYQITDTNTGAIITSEVIEGNYKFEHKWGTYEGDKRALNSNGKRLIKKLHKNSPSKDEMIYNAAQNLTNKIIKNVKNKYK